MVKILIKARGKRSALQNYIISNLPKIKLKLGEVAKNKIYIY